MIMDPNEIQTAMNHKLKSLNLKSKFRNPKFQ